MAEIHEQGRQSIENTFDEAAHPNIPCERIDLQGQQFVMFAACPYCSTQVEAYSAGLRWCPACSKAFALDDSAQSSAGHTLNEAALAQLVCQEDDVALDSRFSWVDPANGDLMLAADFGVDTRIECSTQLHAEIEEDFARFFR
jgi:uncharacterized Zn-finger protein